MLEKPKGTAAVAAKQPDKYLKVLENINIDSLVNSVLEDCQSPFKVSQKSILTPSTQMSMAAHDWHWKY